VVQCIPRLRRVILRSRLGGKLALHGAPGVWPTIISGVTSFVTEQSRAVFLSYASEDAPAAQRIAEALRSAAIEVWFDREELRGGDAWDGQIRQQIHDCRLFIAVVSANTEARDEGYFRREWKLAVNRTHDMSEKKTFLVPVVIDNTSERGAAVPDRFREVQWTRLPDGQTPPAFVERVRRLLSPEAPSARLATQLSPATTVQPSGESVGLPWWSKAGLWVISAVLAVALVYFVVDKFWISKHLAAPHPSASQESAERTTAPLAAPAFTPPPHSIAVLPFVNMSGDKDQEYFSDGLTEELLNSLAEINDLQVAARTSAFSFKGKDTDIGTIARKLNVGAVLEGSVRRSGNTVRVTTQLINAGTGFHLWSHTYDRDLTDVLRLQTDIADAVATALKVTLLGEVAAKIELGGTRNPAAFDAYLRGRKAQLAAHSGNDHQTAIAAFTDAIELDPSYALAFANRSIALATYAGVHARGPAVRESFDKAQQDALKAVALAPDLADGHLALAFYFHYGLLDFTRANEEYEQALGLAPGNARILQWYGRFAATMGHKEAGIAAARRAVILDPLNRSTHSGLGLALFRARQYDAAVAAFQDALALDPDAAFIYAFRGLAYYSLGNLQSAQSSCESKPEDSTSQQCLAVVYDKSGRHADAEAQFAKVKASWGDDAAYGYACIYAQWGNTSKALEWLETALRSRDPGLEELKVDSFLDPLRNEPRFQAVERALKFPD